MVFLDVRVDVALWWCDSKLVNNEWKWFRPLANSPPTSSPRSTRHVALKILPRKLKTAWSCHSKDHKHLNEGLLYSLTRKKNNL